LRLLLHSKSGPAVWLVLFSVCSLGCATHSPNESATGTAPDSPFPIPHSLFPSFQRHIAPFAVLDERGQPYGLPFLGGLDVPRPQFVDIDADNDLDLFVQERSNELMFLENTASGFAWRTDKYQELDVGEWTRFIDIDADGDIDLLTEQQYSHLRLYRNEGSKQRALFKLAADTLRDQAGKAIFADRQNIPNIIDVDCNGLLDLFIGRVEGTVTHYEEITGSRARAGVPSFAFITERWQDIEIVKQMGSAHGANTMYFADHDGDGDVDLFWGDFFEDGVLLIENRGSCRNPDLHSEPVPLNVNGAKLSTSGYNVPVLADLDGDNDLDLFVGVLGGAYNPSRTSANNFYYAQRLPDGEYEMMTRRFVYTIDLGNESAPAVGDVDGDGDLDLLVGSKLDPIKQTTARLYLFRNVGTKTQARLQLADTIDAAEGFHYVPTLGDLDADGDLDLMLGTWNQGVLFYRNQGSRTQPRWLLDTSLTLQLSRGSNATPALVDLDADGDLDLMVGEASGEFNYYRNSGTRHAFRFELVSDAYQALDAGRRSHPAFLDADGDGDLDLLSGTEVGGSAFFRNDGTRQEPRFVNDSSVMLPLPVAAAVTFADLDGDGRLELLSGGSSGGLWYFLQRN
jgi:hypothetical protein